MANALPNPPDFASIEAAAPASAGKQASLLMDLGAMGLAWANSESVFVYVLMLLLRTDEVSAAIVFSTLNTTRARLDLVRRLGKIKIKDDAVARTLERIVRKFEACTAVRNELSHCVFTIDGSGEITHTRSLRIEERRGALSLGLTRPIDEARRSELRDTNKAMKRLNRELWDFLPVLKAHCDPAPASR